MSLGVVNSRYGVPMISVAAFSPRVGTRLTRREVYEQVRFYPTN